MKKSLIFASFIALVAMLAVSCKPNVEKPKALFDYSVDGMTVTFQNMSKNADSYAWEFGDGEKSTEKDPTHTYAELGTYTVKLTATNAGGDAVATQDVVLEAKSIVIDGDFADWEGAKDVAVAKTSEDAKFEALYVMKFCTDADYIYFYAEFDNSTYDYLDDAGETAVGFMVDPIDIYLNIDGDQNTGSNSYLWENSAADVLIEGFWSDNFESAGVYTFPADAAQDAWAWEDAEIAGSTTTSDKKVLANGHAAIEGKITMAMLPFPVAGVKAGIFTSNTQWKESGCLPETVINDDGTSTPSPLLEVKLNK